MYLNISSHTVRVHQLRSLIGAILTDIVLWRIGGNVNLIDDDGETPLYTVENVETARWLVDHGATVGRTNNEGVSVRFQFSRTGHSELDLDLDLLINSQ